MKMDKLSYGLVVSDDDYEMEIVIVGSPGQSGHCSLVIVQMGVDGGIHGMPSVITNIPYGEVQNHEILPKLSEGLQRIREKFVQPYTFLSDEDITEILLAWNDDLFGE